jgi:HSP20 family protein
MSTKVQTATPSKNEVSSSDSIQSYVLPPVDIAEDESGFTLFADLPGVSKEDLSVHINGDNLVIEGTIQTTAPDQMSLVYGEAQFSRYRRQFTLSRELDRSQIQASLNNGVLKLTVPKTAEAKPRRIEVSVG